MAKVNLFKHLALAGMLVLSMMACKDKPDKKNIDTSGITTSVPAPHLESSWDSTAAEKKCYSNKGLTYDVVVTIEQNGDSTLSGTVESKDLETEHSETVSFTGTVKGKNYFIKFDATPPVVGKASQWTTKPWRIVDEVGKSNFPHMLHIPFNAKNYDTNKWEDSDYIFAPVDCK